MSGMLLEPDSSLDARRTMRPRMLRCACLRKNDQEGASNPRESSALVSFQCTSGCRLNYYSSGFAESLTAKDPAKWDDQA
jgi:hypothetical protein